MAVAVAAAATEGSGPATTGALRPPSNSSNEALAAPAAAAAPCRAELAAWLSPLAREWAALVGEDIDPILTVIEAVQTEALALAARGGPPPPPAAGAPRAEAATAAAGAAAPPLPAWAVPSLEEIRGALRQLATTGFSLVGQARCLPATVLAASRLEALRSLGAVLGDTLESLRRQRAAQLSAEERLDEDLARLSAAAAGAPGGEAAGRVTEGVRALRAELRQAGRDLAAAARREAAASRGLAGVGGNGGGGRFEAPGLPRGARERYSEQRAGALHPRRALARQRAAAAGACQGAAPQHGCGAVAQAAAAGGARPSSSSSASAGGLPRAARRLRRGEDEPSAPTSCSPALGGASEALLDMRALDRRPRPGDQALCHSAWVSAVRASGGPERRRLGRQRRL